MLPKNRIYTQAFKRVVISSSLTKCTSHNSGLEHIPEPYSLTLQQCLLIGRLIKYLTFGQAKSGFAVVRTKCAPFRAVPGPEDTDRPSGLVLVEDGKLPCRLYSFGLRVDSLCD